MRITILMALGLAACVQPEEGISDDRIRGTVRVVPTSSAESDNYGNRRFQGAEALPMVFYGFHLHTGTIDGFGEEGWQLDDGAKPPQRVYSTDLTEGSDQDWYSLMSEEEHEVTLSLQWEGSSTLRFGLYDLDDIQGGGPGDPERPALLQESDFAGGAELTFTMEAGHNYALRVAGVSGSDPVDYTMVVPGWDPNDAGILVGAYLPAEGGGAPEAANRSNPVAGTNAAEFTLVEDEPYTYEASYEMFLVREVNTTEDTGDGSTTTTNEFVEEVWLFAGNWSTLQPRLSAGTWFSSEPVQVVLDGDPQVEEPGEDAGRWDEAIEYYEASETLVPDAIAPAVIGMTLEEEEPNDMPFDAGTFVVDTSDPSLAQDLGLLSGDGFIDIVNGNMDIVSAESGFVHDIDAFHFMVPSRQTVYFEMDWEDDGADLDVVINNAAGEPLDWAASLDKPEMSGGFAEMLPEESYYLVVLGYSGTEGTSPAYSVRLEHAGL